MTLLIIDCEQNTPEWLAARAGIPTASQFSTVMAKGKGKDSPSVTRQKYMLTLIADQMGAAPGESYSNAAMERGHLLEDEARATYELMTGNASERVGFMRRALDGGDAGASPDRLIDDLGLLEIKTAAPHIQLQRILDNELPSEHRAQTQGQLWISGRQWCDFVSYWPGLPIFIYRVQRDNAYIAELAIQVQQFHHDMRELRAQIEAYA